MHVNRICELLNIRYPIVQAPMNWVSGPELVAAVSGAGGLGTLGPNAGSSDITHDVHLTGERIRQRIHAIRALTDAPFGVNIVVGFGEDTKYSKKVVDVVVEEKVPVAVVSVGSPRVYTDRLKQAGIIVLHAISTAEHARKAARAGVDAVICEGWESGGHKGLTGLTTFALTPMVADAVDIPVITGGGIADARGILAAMALGADGVYVGTRFMVTRQSASHENVKRAILEAQDACTDSIPKGKMIARDLSNAFTAKHLELVESGAELQAIINHLEGHSQYHSQLLGDAGGAEICCGQGASLIHDIPDAAELVATLVDEVASRFAQLEMRLNGLLKHGHRSAH
ncbi:MAG: nitronate monooxygenase [Desulfatitalea sp.]|nr:nitronate monooxygenase [Desulfatitalea sp.]